MLLWRELLKKCSRSSPSIVSRKPLPTLHKRNVTTAHGDDSLSYVADIISSQTCKNILVVSGAGISTPSGIPDFRTLGFGLYDNLDEYNLSNPTDIFDLYHFIRNPRPFFKLAKQLYPGSHAPNYVHYFLKLLSQKNKLLRIYTQNIDSLEIVAGVPEDQIVAAHGSFATATCIKCEEKYSGDLIKNDIMSDVVPECRNIWCDGIIKPDVVFFGEDLPRRFFLIHNDLPKCDLLLVLGTSLEVYPVAGLIYEAAKHIPRVLFNREIVEPFTGGPDTRPTDAVYSGDIVQGVEKLVSQLNWSEDIKEIMKG